MKKNKLITSFHDTLHFAEYGAIAAKTELAKLTSVVYEENFISDKKRLKMQGEILVESGTAFATAQKYISYGKTAVLSFANPVIPGGNPQGGGTAQEECLCRSSNLYPCLTNKAIYEKYYGYHRKLASHWYSDRIIYTKDITVFKDDGVVPKQMSEKEWFQVDVITCSAPYMAKQKILNRKVLKEVFKKRIKNIFETAYDNEVSVLILGAFGCGAFKNPSDVVAIAFYEVIKENYYDMKFNKIVFASTGNMLEFQNKFLNILDQEKQNFNSNTDKMKVVEKEIIMPSGKILHGKEAEIYREWQKNNVYSGKQFSILGDSISTLEGCNPKDYNVFYYEKDSIMTGIKDVTDTWWGKVVEFFGGEILVNNSWSGSRVTKLPNREALFPSGCCIERTSGLHIGTVKPDVIIVYLGTNDWAFGAESEFWGMTLNMDINYGAFPYAYEYMIQSIKGNYPECEVWCCTLSETYIPRTPSFKFPHSHGGTHIEVYNKIIREIAERTGCKLIDLYSYGIPYESLDGTHPNSRGMSTLATLMIREMIESIQVQSVAEKGKLFLKCNEGEHEFMRVEGKVGEAKYICKKCAFEKATAILANHEIVRLDPEKTTDFFMDTIYFLHEQEMIKIQKDEIMVGREQGCDILFKTDLNIARHHAIFYYAETQWYLMNLGINGTSINGKMLELGKLYMLYKYDVIEFANSEKLVFCGDREKDVRIYKEQIASKDAQRNQSDKDEFVGKIIDGKYQVLFIIKDFGTEKIMAAKDLHLNKIWTIKAMFLENKHREVLYAHACAEIQIHKKLDHPLIVRVIDAIIEFDVIYVVMDCSPCLDLDEVINKTRMPLPAERVVNYAIQIAEGLRYLHTLNPPIIHRDIKPSNILLIDSERVKICDFGIAREYHPSKLCDTVCLGTKGYAPPEQFGGSVQTDQRTDIFALGMTMHHLVTGIAPYKSRDYVYKSICAINLELPKGLEYIIDKCTKLDMKERYQNCQELIVDLRCYQNLPPKKGFLQKLFWKK